MGPEATRFEIWDKFNRAVAAYLSTPENDVVPFRRDPPPERFRDPSHSVFNDENNRQLVMNLTLDHLPASSEDMPWKMTFAVIKRPIHRIICGKQIALCGENALYSPHKVREMYVYERKEWPRFTWDTKQLAEPLAAVRHRQGRLIGSMEALGFKLRQEAVLQTLTVDVLKTSEIEGEQLDAEQVRSSLARRLGMDVGALKPADRNVEGVVEMMLDATGRYDQVLTADRLFGWAAALFPTGRSGIVKINTGAWRDDGNGPMQVVSGPVGRERVHFQAPAAAKLDGEMKAFLYWFNTAASNDPVLKAGIAHLWFVTIHPFGDGNGRIARAITDMSLARSEDSPHRFYSMSDQIRQKRKSYYEILEQTQKGTADITPWMAWFLDCLGSAIEGAHTTLAALLAKARFWERIAGTAINERQRMILNRLLDGFEGKLTTSKYAKLINSSNDTALRDILFLVENGILARNPEGGRSTSYDLVRKP
jgi:Fic family protein